MKSWLKWGLGALALSQLPTQSEAIEFAGDDNGDSMFPLVLLQMITQRDNQYAMQSLYPLLLSSIMGNDAGNDKAMYYLLLGAGTDSNMQQWLPLILNNGQKSISDKLLMMIFMQQAQVGGGTDMNAMFPLLLLNGNDNKYCQIAQDKCVCKDDNSEMLLYIMLLNGNQFGADNQYSNFMFMMFDNDSCEGQTTAGNECRCTTDDEIEGGIDAVTYLMMMQMNPVVKQQLPESPPQRAIDIKDLLKKQLFANLGPEYQWMQNAQSADTSELVKFQLYQQMGIPPNVMSILANGGAEKTTDEKFALIQWMAEGSEMSIETMSLMLGIEDAKQFYIHSMIEDGNVDPMTASLLLASQGNTSKDKMKEMLIMAATGQIDPSSFATIAKPYVPELPAGTYPGQELYFIHLEMMDLNTCALIEPTKRKPCGKNFGAYVTADQCEVHPYCCYNPYFGTAEMSQDEIKEVPWCYYNIFFVFHDQYKLRIKEADQFKGPQDCPGLFRYGLNLDPFMYYTAVNDLNLQAKAYGGSNYVRQVSSENVSTQKLAKLIHLRQDVGFPGITEFHCRAIMGACWDSNAAQYPAQYGIPQCYEEASVTDGSKTLNLYDPQLFKPVVPAQFRGAEGECDTNYFHVSTLYYERRACTYDIEMIKYGTDYSPLAEPTREDCLFRLGCCYEDNEEVMAKYPFMPRCYQRIKDDSLETRVFQTKPLLVDGKQVCGADVDAFIKSTLDPTTANPNGSIYQAIKDYKLKYLAPMDDSTDAKIYEELPASEVMTKEGACMWMNTNTRHDASTCVNQDDCQFWKVFDLFNKDTAKDYYKKYDGIPVELQNMVNDLF